MAMRESIRAIPENPCRPEVGKGPKLVGADWLAANKAWYKEIGMEVPNVPYIIHESTFVTPDGAPIKRDKTREREVISSYLDLQDKNYVKDLKAAAASLPPMDASCRIAVQIPAHNEEKSIYHTLKQWAGQVDNKGESLSSSIYEINIINNGQQGYSKDDTSGEVERFRSENPNVKVNFLDVEFPINRGNVGMARKFMTDVILLRSLNRQQQNDPLYIESGDADILTVDPKTLASRIKQFDEKPHIDAIAGEVDFYPEKLMENDFIFFTIRAREIAKKQLQIRRLRPENNSTYGFYNAIPTRGCNTAFSAEAYALSGGYLATIIGEDTELGKRFNLMRGSYKDNIFVPNTHTVINSPIRMQTSPRRHIYSAIHNVRPYQDYADVAMTQGMRDIPLDAIGSISTSRISVENVADYEKTMNRQMQFFKRNVSDPEEQIHLFKQMAAFLGFGKYKVRENANGIRQIINSSESNEDTSDWESDFIMHPDNTVCIVNIGNLKSAFDRYRTKRSAA